MIESNIIEWLDFGDSIQKIDAYSRPTILFFFGFFRVLLKYRISYLIEIILMIIYFIQLLCISSSFIDKKGETIIQIFDYYKNIFVVSNLISSNQKYYLQLFIINNAIISIIYDVEL